ncbi:MAG: transcriptional regulator [Rhodobacterales bacterium]|nr:MAG: transcriptional regulator [Rhodobacterales bacterium]
MAERKPRLTREDWLTAGLVALEEQGPGALAAEPLARALGTTKGSFYWHFKDVATFRMSVAEAWEARALAAIAAAPRDGAATERLLALSRPDPAEAAMRGWARRSPQLAAVVGHVDRARATALRDSLAGLGLTNPEFARIVQAAVIGMETLGDTAPLSTLLAAILALQDA